MKEEIINDAIQYIKDNNLEKYSKYYNVNSAYSIILTYNISNVRRL